MLLKTVEFTDTADLVSAFLASDPAEAVKEAVSKKQVNIAHNFIALLLTFSHLNRSIETFKKPVQASGWLY